MDDQFPETPLAIDRLDVLVRQEIMDFRRGFEKQPVPAEQDLRAGAVAWVAAFVPEAIARELRELLFLTCDGAREGPDFDHHGWYRTIYLDVAGYLLSGDAAWLDVLIANIDHHASQLRSSLYGPLGLAAPRLKLTHPELVLRVESNLRKHHFYNDSLMCVFCQFQAEPGTRLAQLEYWRAHIDLTPQDIATVETLINRQRLSNGLVFDEYAEISRYLFCRLLDPVFGHRARSDPFEGAERKLTLNTLWQRMSGHPLMKPFIQLEMGKT